MTLDHHTHAVEFSSQVLRKGNRGCGILVSPVPKESKAFFSLRDPSEVQILRSICAYILQFHLQFIFVFVALFYLDNFFRCKSFWRRLCNGRNEMRYECVFLILPIWGRKIFYYSCGFQVVVLFLLWLLFCFKLFGFCECAQMKFSIRFFWPKIFSISHGKCLLWMKSLNNVQFCKWFYNFLCEKVPIILLVYGPWQ